MKPICIINDFGTKRWYLYGDLHREDGPAVEYANGSKSWFINGELHRDNGPACEYANGDKYWYLNDLLHREDGPAAEYANGDNYWYYRGNHIDCKDNQEFLRIIKLKIFL